MLLQFWHLWKTQRCLFRLLKRCGYADCSWDFWVLILVFMFLKDVFFVFVLDPIFCGTNFFIFQDTMWLVKSSWCFHCCSIHQFYWVSDRCRSRFAPWWLLSEESCRHKLVVSTSFWSWLLNISSVLISLKYTATFFLDCYYVKALWVCWRLLGVLSFWFWSSCFWKMSFFVFILDAIFRGTNFFIFQDSV